ncbi:MAG TPA: hypothetical protein VN841_15295 [Bryobacteraceae bacterium]|nr:hypothetical protein [Bryobacteraceae bacterium]
MPTRNALTGTLLIAAVLPLMEGRAGAQAGEARFPVAHFHFGTVCRGFLYVSSNGVRYEVVQPVKDRNHSFQISRGELTAVQPWIVAGRMQNIAEIRTARAVYHFGLLPSDGEVNSGGVFNANSAGPAATLVAALQNPSGGSSLAAKRPPDAASAAGAGPAATAVQPDAVSSADPPPPPAGMLDGIYVALDIPDQKVRRLIFSPDGWVVKDIPQETMIGFNFTAYRNSPTQNRQFIGRYQVAGDTINIDWQDFRGPAFGPNREVVKRDEVNAHPVSLNIAWDIFIPMCRCTGKRFSGKYNWGQNQYLQFSPDGTFLDYRVTDQLIVPSQFYEHPRIQRGTYSIQSQTLILTFADGHRGTRTFIAPKAQEKEPIFDWIGLGWKQLYEENYEIRLRQGQR